MKEELPSILVADGWETDNNDISVGIVIPSTVGIYQSPTKVTFFGDTIVSMPFTKILEFEAPKITTLSEVNLFVGCTSLQTVTFSSLRYIVDNLTGSSSYIGIFNGCSSLTTVNMPELLEINLTATRSQDGKKPGTFGQCSSLQNINMPKLKNIIYNKSTWDSNDGVFANCLALETVNLPSIETIGARTFNKCTTLKNVTLGSEDNPVSTIDSDGFYNCTQSDLTITIYTEGGASLANEKWGATNATIVYMEA